MDKLADLIALWRSQPLAGGFLRNSARYR